MNNNANNGNDPFLAAQQKRIDAAKAKMTARQELIRQRQKRETEKLYRLVGELCCKAAQRPGFAGPLQEVLTESDERARTFLRQKGLL
jgi:hypothetical protein